MDYLLKSTICLTAFYGLYFFGFRRMSFHTLNRFYLLASLALSLTIPMISYERTEIVLLEPQPIEEVTLPSEEIYQRTDNQATTLQQRATIEKSPNIEIDWMQVLNTIYLVGVGAMITLFLKNILTIFYCIKKATSLVASTGTPAASLSHQRSGRNLKILHTESQSNSSFFNYVFLNPENLNPHEKALIIAHEGFHAQLLHTLDLLFLGILKAIFWFNPIIYFYQKSLKQIHEYEVDSLMSATYDGREYAHLLLKLGVAPNALIINQFSTKPLTERIQFLFKTPTKNMKKLLYFLSLPIIAVGVMAFAEEKVVRVYQEKTAQKSILKKEQKDDLQFSIPVDTSTKKKITQTDIFTHKIDFNLNLTNVDSVKLIVDNRFLTEGKDYILKENDIYLVPKYSKSKAHIHIYSKSKGNYGRYKGSNIFTEFTKLEDLPYTQLNRIGNKPIFEVKNGKEFFSKLPSIFYKVTKSDDTLRTIFETNRLGKNPLVIINGEEYPSSILYRINPNSTQGSLTYPKGNQRAIEKYGLRASDGVIIFNTIKNKELLLKNEKQYRIAIENVKKQLEAPKKRVQRLILKDLDGNEYEKVSIMRLDLISIHFSVEVPVGGKIIFTVDGKTVSEEDIENEKQLFIGGGCGETQGGKYDAYIDLNTK